MTIASHKCKFKIRHIMLHNMLMLSIWRLLKKIQIYKHHDMNKRYNINQSVAEWSQFPMAT